MDFEKEALQIRQTGMEKAALIWGTLEHLPQPIDPTDVFKAVSSVKCAEFIVRTHTHKLAPMIMKCVGEFLSDSLGIIGDAEGGRPDALRVLAVIDQFMPMNEEVLNDDLACAMRQHVFDGILLLSAAKLGKETETKKSLENMAMGVAKVLIVSYLMRENMQGIADFDPDKPQA